jgi:hypothetical protein
VAKQCMRWGRPHLAPFLCSISLLQVFLEAESVVVAGLSPEAVVLAAEPEVLALVFAVAQLSPQVVVLVAEPEVVSAVVEPEVVVLAVEPEVVSVAEPQASADIAVAFVVLVPVSVVAVEVDSSGRPKFLAFPNVDHFASFSSSVEVVG